MKLEPTPPDVQKLFEDEGYAIARLHTPIQPVRTKCPQGHKFETTVAGFKNGDRCARCERKTKLTDKLSSAIAPSGPAKPKTAGKRKPRERSLKRWAKKVIAIARHTCQVCKVVDPKNMEAHHLWAHDTYPEMRHKIDNGMCVCRSCHTEFHQRFGYGGNTPAQMAIFQTRAVCRVVGKTR